MRVMITDGTWLESLAWESLCNSTAYPVVATQVSTYWDFIVATIDGSTATFVYYSI